VLAQLDPGLLADCAQPVSIPATAGLATQARLWSADRRALVECGRNHQGLAAVIQAERAGLQGKNQ
jgi:hypothetical protein